MQRCRGYERRSTLSRDFCGYWDSEVNLDAADEELYEELYELGAFVCG